jgi:hypothetical protein
VCSVGSGLLCLLCVVYVWPVVFVVCCVGSGLLFVVCCVGNGLCDGLNIRAWCPAMCVCVCVFACLSNFV